MSHNYLSADQLNKNVPGQGAYYLEGFHTAGRYADDCTQPGLPGVHRSFTIPRH